MGSDSICKLCQGTGVIHCTTGKDGEMLVSCSCRREKSDKRDALDNKVTILAAHMSS
jgi:hypothetical protein